MPPMQKPKTLNELQRIVYQYLTKHTGGLPDWRGRVSVCDRIPQVMNLYVDAPPFCSASPSNYTDYYSITNHLLALDEGDPMKVAEWSCNFELDTFHKSVSKVQLLVFYSHNSRANPRRRKPGAKR